MWKEDNSGTQHFIPVCGPNAVLHYDLDWQGRIEANRRIPNPAPESDIHNTNRSQDTTNDPIIRETREDTANVIVWPITGNAPTSNPICVDNITVAVTSAESTETEIRPILTPKQCFDVSANVVRGDMNGDGIVNIQDFGRHIMYLKGLNDPHSGVNVDNHVTEYIHQSADMNRDGNVNTQELAMLAEKLLKGER